MAVDYKQYINGLNSAMPDADMNAAALAKRRWDSIAKPLGSLGKLEEMVIKTAALTGGATWTYRGAALPCSARITALWRKGSHKPAAR